MDSDNSGFDLVNSENWFTLGPGRERDRLRNEPEWLDDFLARWGFEQAGAVSARERREALRLRAVLRRVTYAVANENSVPAADLVELNAFLAAQPVRRRLADTGAAFRLDLEPVRTNWASILAEIAASVAELLAHGERARIKVCENPECRWVFYDRGTNRRRRWCEPAICANRDKVRRFRARQRAANPPNSS